MVRIVVHAGFHKTGTTTAQQTLRHNAAVLKPHLRVVLRPRMTALCDAARAWSVSHDELDMIRLQREVHRLAQGWDLEDSRPILISSEDLAGHMPGRRKLTGYDATPGLMHALAGALIHACPQADLRFYFSTRAADPWLQSCHAQHLRVVRMELDAAAYAERYRDSANLVSVVDAVADTVFPVPTSSCALETSSVRPLGPLDPLLDLVGLPDEVRETLEPSVVANRRYDPPTLQALLAANRTYSKPQDLRAAKRAILSSARPKK